MNSELILRRYEREAINHGYSSDWVGGKLFIDDGTNRDLWEDVSDMNSQEFLEFLGY